MEGLLFSAHFTRSNASPTSRAENGYGEKGTSASIHLSMLVSIQNLHHIYSHWNSKYITLKVAYSWLEWVICSANQWTGFYMIGIFVMKELNANWLQPYLLISSIALKKYMLWTAPACLSIYIKSLKEIKYLVQS